MATSNLATKPPRMYSLRELDEAGYGGRHKIMRMMQAGQVPAKKIGNAYKICETDLHLLSEPAIPGVAGKPSNERPSRADEPTMGEYIKALVDTFPKLDADQKAELGKLLAPAS